MTGNIYTWNVWEKSLITSYCVLFKKQCLCKPNEQRFIPVMWNIWCKLRYETSIVWLQNRWMWLEKIGSFLKIDVTWKVIVLGFYHKINDKQYLQRWNAE